MGCVRSHEQYLLLGGMVVVGVVGMVVVGVIGPGLGSTGTVIKQPTIPTIPINNPNNLTLFIVSPINIYLINLFELNLLLVSY